MQNADFFFSFVRLGIRRVGLLWRIIWGCSLYMFQVSGKPVSDYRLGLKAPRNALQNDKKMRLFNKESTFITRNWWTLSVTLTVSRHISSSFSRPLLLQKKNPDLRSLCSRSTVPAVTCRILSRHHHRALLWFISKVVAHSVFYCALWGHFIYLTNNILKAN